MKQLRLGIMTNTDLADWFDIKLDTFKKKRSSYLEKLTPFCKFINLRGKIEVLEIYEPIYVKSESKAYQYYLKEVPAAWHYGQPETCTRVANEIFDSTVGVKESTGIKYTIEVRNKLWGIPSFENPQCQYEQAKMYRGIKPSENRYELLTPTEYDIFKSLHAIYYDPDKEAKQKVLIQEMVEKHELSKEEAFDIICNEMTYKSFISELSAKLHCDWIVCATVVNPGATFD